MSSASTTGGRGRKDTAERPARGGGSGRGASMVSMAI